MQVGEPLAHLAERHRPAALPGRELGAHVPREQADRQRRLVVDAQPGDPLPGGSVVAAADSTRAVLSRTDVAPQCRPWAVELLDQLVAAGEQRRTPVTELDLGGQRHRVRPRPPGLRAQPANRARARRATTQASSGDWVRRLRARVSSASAWRWRSRRAP